jgi:hypothetical protein
MSRKRRLEDDVEAYVHEVGGAVRVDDDFNPKRRTQQHR